MIKFGNLRINGVIQEEDPTASRLVNIGDGAELLAIDNLYGSMGITAIEEVEYAQIHEAKYYDGEYMILPINYAVVPDGYSYEFLHFPDRIIPVYIALGLVNLNVSSEQLAYLKRFEPIGCRDERTMHFLREKGIDAYLFGCMVATYPKRTDSTAKRNKVFFVDAPKSIKPFIPQSIYDQIEFLDHEYYETLDTWGEDSGKSRAKKIIQRYQNEAKLIVTSRFHGAILGLALGIPTILALENNFFKFSWLSKNLRLYTPETFHQIDWDCPAVDFEPIKEQMLKVAEQRIRATYERYKDIYALSFLHENPLRDDSPNLLYCTDALAELDGLWKVSPEQSYILWGTSKNADVIFDYISKNYPQARLMKVYDYMSKKEFNGIQTIMPSEEECLADRDVFTIVVSNSAKQMARDLFDAVGKRKDKYVICELSFLRSEHLK